MKNENEVDAGTPTYTITLDMTRQAHILQAQNGMHNCLSSVLIMKSVIVHHYILSAPKKENKIDASCAHLKEKNVINHNLHAPF